MNNYEELVTKAKTVDSYVLLRTPLCSQWAVPFTLAFQYIELLKSLFGKSYLKTLMPLP